MLYILRQDSKRKTAHKRRMKPDEAHAQFRGPPSSPPRKYLLATNTAMHKRDVIK